MTGSRQDALRYKVQQMMDAGKTKSGLANPWGSNTWPPSEVHYAPPWAVTQRSENHKIIYMAYEGVENDIGKLSSVFVFPLPAGISDGVTTEWDNERNFLQKTGEGLFSGGVGGVVDVIGKKVSKTISGIKSNVTRNSAAFEFEDFYFKNVNKREWSFTHKMTPTSLDESVHMKRIVDQIQFHASPELNGSDLMKPAEWEIHFMSGSTDNSFLPKLNKCILETVTVNNTPNDSFQPSKNNFPNDVDIEFSFKEMLIRTKNDITKFR